MSAEDRELLRATIYNLASGNEELFFTLSSMTDEEIENTLNDILRK